MRMKPLKSRLIFKDPSLAIVCMKIQSSGSANPWVWPPVAKKPFATRLCLVRLKKLVKKSRDSNTNERDILELLKRVCYAL